jgi:hypothetical protein
MVTGPCSSGPVSVAGRQVREKLTREPGVKCDSVTSTAWQPPPVHPATLVVQAPGFTDTCGGSGLGASLQVIELVPLPTSPRLSIDFTVSVRSCPSAGSLFECCVAVTVQEEIFSLATTRRGVVPVGPATTVRGDPFGLVRRTVPWSEVVELVVHPITVGIESLGAGVLRDLEGQTTNETSTSDLAFHTLREYAPGDDRRYIHWRSSARASALSGETTLLVRQFLDTRRSHLTAIVDGQASSYLDEIDFETAISAAASVVRRAFTDDVDTTVLAAQCSLYSGNLPLALDTFSRAEFGTDVGLTTLAARAAQLAPDTTVALLVTGAQPAFTELQHAAMYFPPEVSVVAVRVDPTKPAGITGLQRLVVLSLPQLSGLRSLLVGSGR